MGVFAVRNTPSEADTAVRPRSLFLYFSVKLVVTQQVSLSPANSCLCRSVQRNPANQCSELMQISSLALGLGLLYSVVLMLHVWRSLVVHSAEHVGMETALQWKTWAKGVGSLHRLWSHHLAGSTGPTFHRAVRRIHRSQPCTLISVCLGQGTT